MPTYEYACAACGHKFEEFQSIKAAPIKKCPKCGKNKVQRLISAGAGFIFKGSGFYQTDYRSESYKAGEKADAAPSAAPAKTESDAKPKTDTAATPAPAATTAAPSAPASAPAKPAAAPARSDSAKTASKKSSGK